MKKNILLFVIMLLTLFTFPQVGRAAEATGEVTGTISFGRSLVLRDIHGLEGSGTFPNATIGGQLAVCRDVGLPASSGVVYRRGEKITESYLIKAYNYIKSKGNTDVARAVGQAYIWASERGTNTQNAISSFIFRYYLAEGGFNMRTAMEEAQAIAPVLNNEIQSQSANAVLYTWHPTTGNYQRFISGPKGGTTSLSTCNPITSTNAGECCDVPGASELPDYDKWCKNPPTGKKCPDPTVSIADCDSNSEYHDPNLPDWECIKGVDQYKETNQNTLAVSRNYCTIYCREDAYTDFPGGGATFGAGRYFTVGSSNLGPTWGPVCIKSQRECRTFYKSGSTYVEGINYTAFYNDYTAINNLIVEKWEAYQRAQLQAEATEYTVEHMVNCNPHSTGEVYKAHAEPIWEPVKTPAGTISGYRFSGRYSYTCNRQGPAGVKSTGSGDNMYCYPQEWGRGYYTNDNRKGDYCGAAMRYCTAGENKSALGGARSAYYNAVSQRQSYINAVNSCVTLSTNYKIDPDVKFNYPDDKSYSTNGLQLKENISMSTSGANNNGSTAVLNYKNCSSMYHFCTESTISIPKIVNSTQNRKVDSGNACYSLPDNYYRYVYKINGECYTQSMINDDITWIRLDDTYVPVTTTMLPGKYHLGLTYTSIGNVVSGTAHFDQYVSKTTGSNISEYVCDYNIDNGLLCGSSVCETKATGIDIIYRPISLSTPFPGQSGRGRKTGSNWCNNEDCSNTNAVVNRVITKNRGVTTEEVYNLEPIYSATLTPNIIKSIRAYNRNKNYDYGDFDLVCEKGNGGTTGKKCISSFIHSSDYSSLFSGSCANASSNQFDSCR